MGTNLENTEYSDFQCYWFWASNPLSASPYSAFTCPALAVYCLGWCALAVYWLSFLTQGRINEDSFHSNDGNPLRMFGLCNDIWSELNANKPNLKGQKDQNPQSSWSSWSKSSSTSCQVSSVVLHWGEDPSLGSEHTIQGKAAAAEVSFLDWEPK